MKVQDTAFSKSIDSTDVSVSHVKNDDLFLRNPIIHAEITKLLEMSMDKVIDAYIRGHYGYVNNKELPMPQNENPSKVRIAAMLVLDMFCQGNRTMLNNLLSCHKRALRLKDGIEILM
jgi:hypothetical protein